MVRTEGERIGGERERGLVVRDGGDSSDGCRDGRVR